MPLDAAPILRRFADRLADIGRAGLFRRRFIRENPQGPRIVVEDRRYLAFCSNDYLGLASHPDIVEAAVTAARDWGVGEGASHLLSGHSAWHERVETALADFVQMPRSLLFSTGYQANIGAITALVGAGDVVFSDALNHASLIDGMHLSRARVVRYPHLDLEFLEEVLATSSEQTKLVATDAVFSMDGDLAPLDGLLGLCERYDAWLLVDDAHGLGVLGPEGRGSLARLGLSSPRIVYVGTLGKAVGVSGAFVAGATELVELVLQRARTYIYTTAAPSMLAAAVEASLRLVRKEEWRRAHLRKLSSLLRENARNCGIDMVDSATPIHPIVLGPSARALEASEGLRAAGILVPPIRPPTVPEGTARLRISLSALHTEEDVHRLATGLREMGPSRATLET